MNLRQSSPTLAALVLASIVASSSRLYAAPASLDVTFGNGGKFITDFGDQNQSEAVAVAIQADGKIVVAGDSVLPTGGGTFALARFGVRGDLDKTFGEAGKVTTNFGTLDLPAGQAASLAIQSDGKILVAGRSSNGANFDFTLARYDTSGDLDQTFNGGGKVTTDLAADDFVWAMALQADGKIVVVGNSATVDTSFVALARYNSDGTLDESFGAGGVVTSTSGRLAIGLSVAIQGDDKILVTGASGTPGPQDFLLVRYNADGTIDQGFGDNGEVTTDFGDTSDESVAVMVQADGKIVLAGTYYQPRTYQDGIGLARYNPDGSPDRSYGIGGKAMFPGDVTVTAAAMQDDGEVVVAGISERTLETADFGLSRFTPDGRADDGFNNGLMSGTTEFGVAARPFAVAIQGDGRIVVVGGSTFKAEGNVLGKFLMARYVGGRPTPCRTLGCRPGLARFR